MVEENNYIKIEFSYIDQFGQESSLSKKLSTCVFDDMDEMDVLVEEFKRFLISAGHAQTNVDKIKVAD